MTELATAVILPSAAIEGLNEVQIGIMRETVADVTNNFRVAGQAIRATAESLYRLKSVVGRGEWIRFLKSGALPISEKTARDLVTSWEKWLSSSPVSDGDLVGLSARTLGKLAQAAPEVRERVMAAKRKGIRVTEAVVTKASSGRTVQKKVISNEVLTLRKEVKRLQEENAVLEEQLRMAIEAGFDVHLMTA